MSDQLVHGQPLYNDDGDLLGVALQAADGAWVVVSEHGEVIAAADAEGNAVNPGDYELESEDIDPRAEELTERMEAIENGIDQMNQRSQFQIYQPSPDSEEQHVARMNAGREQFERREGRPMTMAEQRAFGYSYVDTVERGDYPDVEALADQSKLHNLDTHQGRVDYGTSRLNEDSEDAVTGQPERRAYEYDEDTHQGRVDRMLDQLAGHDTGPSYDYDDELE